MVKASGRRSGGFVLNGLTAAIVLAALVLGLVVAPPDAIQGQAQRLMYLHVPAAWTAYCAYAVVLACSATYLIRPVRRVDACAQAAAEIGVVMTAVTIAVGSVWGHFAWGVWWTWDARLVSTAVLLLIYLGYLGVRGISGDGAANRRRAAIVGVVAFAQVPVVHFSVLWWRTLHQPPTLLAPSTSPPIDARMLAALMVSLVASMLVGWAVFRRRVRHLVAATAAAPRSPVPQGSRPAEQPTVNHEIKDDAKDEAQTHEARPLAGAQGGGR
jgi:heme exporter protein C